MRCYHPIPARVDASGGSPKLWPDVPNSTVPCGACLGCRTARAKEWALRATHEASLHEHNHFVTLTYDDKWLPAEGSLDPDHTRLWLYRVRKALRDRANPALGVRLRYLLCGEYGEKFGRPHYHALLFGVGFDDIKAVNAKYGESQWLTKLWGMGRVSVQAFSPAAAAYTAQYTMKKIGRSHCNIDGVVLHPPFLRASNRPGLGAHWLCVYANDTQHGYVTEDGKKRPVPKYYRKLLHQLEQPQAQSIDAACAEQRIEMHKDPNQALRRRAAEIIHQRRNQLLRKREF